jgi:hypothetical protein
MHPPPENNENPLTINIFLFVFIPIYGRVNYAANNPHDHNGNNKNKTLQFRLRDNNTNSNNYKSNDKSLLLVSSCAKPQDLLVCLFPQMLRSYFYRFCNFAALAQNDKVKNRLNDFLIFNILTIPKTIKAMFSFLGRHCFFICAPHLLDSEITN